MLQLRLPPPGLRSLLRSDGHRSPRNRKRSVALFSALLWCYATIVVSGVCGDCLVSAWVNPPPVAVSPASPPRRHNGCCGSGSGSFPPRTDIFLGSSSNNAHDNANANVNEDAQEYRSIADVVGGLHGGKYQFGGDASSPSIGGIGISDAFSGHGGSVGEDQNDDELPNWAKSMAPTNTNDKHTAPPLRVPSNSNPMDGMVYSASIEIRNQERTWEKFYAKLMVRCRGGVGDPIDPSFVELGASSEMDSNCRSVTVSPSSGSLAPRGGASNACDASQPYSDRATLRVTQAQAPSGESDVWLVVGTEEEQWTYRLDLLGE